MNCTQRPQKTFVRMKNIFLTRARKQENIVLEKLVYLSLTFEAQCDDVVKLNCRDCIRTVNQSDFSQIQLTSMTKHTCSLTLSVIIINLQLYIDITCICILILHILLFDILIHCIPAYTMTESGNEFLQKIRVLKELCCNKNVQS